VLLGHFVNCMSGNATETGMSLGHMEFKDAIIFCSVVLFFIFGAFLSAKALDNHRHGHIPVLIGESFLLVLVRYMALTPALFMASMAMGLQNGLTTCTTWETGKVRTTHVTGTTTDIGVSLANRNLHETGFTVFQAVMYLGGAVFAFMVAHKVGGMAFTLGGAAILLILVVDSAGRLFEHKTLD